MPAPTLAAAAPRRPARRRLAIRVTFEDERVIGDGVATTSVSYIATGQHGTDAVERRLWHPGRWI